MKKGLRSNPTRSHVEEITTFFNDEDRENGLYWVHADAVFVASYRGMVQCAIGDWICPLVQLAWDVPDLDPRKSSVEVIHPTLGKISAWFFNDEVTHLPPAPISEEATQAYVIYLVCLNGGGCPI